MTVVRHWLAVASVVALLATGLGAGSIALAQDQGSPGLEATRTARVQPEQTPESDTTAPDVAQTDNQSSDGESASPDTSEPSPNAADITISGMDQTIAQGLAAFDDFSEGIWRITEIEPLSVDEAPAVTAPYYGFLYQMEGNTIIRNNVTGKRARLPLPTRALPAAEMARLRGQSDAIALRLRHHDDAVHAQRMPTRR